jgi:hypothetical protein
MAIDIRNILTLIALIEHLYVATQWNSAQRKLSAMLIHPRGKWTTEPNGKSKDSNTAPTSDPVVAILVNGDKDSQCHQGHEN